MHLALSVACFSRDLDLLLLFATGFFSGRVAGWLPLFPVLTELWLKEQQLSSITAEEMQQLKSRGYSDAQVTHGYGST